MKILAIVVAAAAIQGCAFTDARLDVRNSPTATYKGPMSSVEPTSFTVAPLADERPDKQRIGNKRNGFGQKTADITTTNLVTAIVADGVKAGLQRNGHSIAGTGDVKITGAVTRFWFEVDPNMFTVDFTGNIECKLEFADAKSGAKIYSSTYTGTNKKTTGGGLEATWTEVMNTAVDKLVEDVVFDADLVEALQARRVPAPAPASDQAPAPATAPAPASPMQPPTPAPAPASNTPKT